MPKGIKNDFSNSPVAHKNRVHGENSPLDVLIYERYQDQAALEAHRESQHFISIVIRDLQAKLEHRQVDVCEI